MLHGWLRYKSRIRDEVRDDSREKSRDRDRGGLLIKSTVNSPLDDDRDNRQKCGYDRLRERTEGRKIHLLASCF